MGAILYFYLLNKPLDSVGRGQSLRGTEAKKQGINKVGPIYHDLEKNIELGSSKGDKKKRVLGMPPAPTAVV